MPQHLILSVLGPDRPGLVNALSTTVSDHGGNWLESRMAKLAGHFAGVVRVAVPADQADALAESLRALADQGLLVSTTTAPAPGSPGSPGSDEGTTPESSENATGAAAQTPALHLTFLGYDRPGIVRDIAHALATRGLNITELTSGISSAPMTGEPMFQATATVAAPPNTDLDALQDQLEALAETLSMDLTLTTLPA